MEATEEKQRLHRFVRRLDTAGLMLTDRDLAILSDLYHCRFLSAHHFERLYGTSAGLGRRLTRLFRNGYVDRPEAQRIWRIRKGGGSKPLVYALAARGAAALAERGRVDRRRRDWTERNRDLSEFSSAIRHELAIGDVVVAFRRACAARPELRFTFIETIASGRQGLTIPGGARPVYPDRIFVIERGREEACLFFVEVDRGTEPNTRRGSGDLQSLERKFESYLAYARAEKHVEQFGVGNFRVLTVTTGGEAKVRNVAEIAGTVCAGVGGGRFLITNFSELERSDALTLPWCNAVGERVPLSL